MTYLKATIGSFAIGMMVLFGGLVPSIASANNNSTAGTSVEVGITEGGKVLVRGAKVTAISGSTITAQTTFGSAALTWTVNTTSSTSFSSAQNGASSLSAIVVGDTISFAGSGTGTNIFTVNATAVKDWSRDIKPATISGTISAISGSASSFTLKKSGKSDKTYTVNLVSGATVTLNSATSAFGNLTVNDGVKVTGTLSSDGTLLTATSVVATRPAMTEEDKDFSRLIKKWFSNKTFLKFHQ